MKVALITGGARGIGRAVAQNLAADHEVAITYCSTAPQGTHCAIKADLRDPASAKAVIAQVLDTFGRLDVIVNNAGAIEMTDLASVDAQTESDTLAVNLIAPMTLLSAALPHLSPGASVVNISSVNAALPAMGAAGYSASKAALETWTRGAAKELGPKGIRVNAVAPGAIERAESPRPPELVQKFVELTALGRVGLPEDIAKAVRFLVSDEADFITGQVLRVCGGYRL